MLIGSTQRSATLPSFVLVAATLVSCAHGASRGATEGAHGREHDALAHALAHPTARDRPLLEERLRRLEARPLPPVGAPARIALLRERIALLSALMQLAEQRLAAFESAVADPQTPAGLRDAIVASARSSRDDRERIRGRLDEALAMAVSSAAEDPEADDWLARRLELAVPEHPERADAVAAQIVARPRARARPRAALWLAARVLEAGEPERALSRIRLVLAVEAGEAPSDDATRREAMAMLPRAYVRSRPEGSLRLPTVHADLAALGCPSAEHAALVLVVAREAAAEGRVEETLGLLRALLLEPGGLSAEVECAARGSLVEMLVTRQAVPEALELVRPALAQQAARRELERGSALERGCRVALLEPALALATVLYRQALGLPSEAVLGGRVPEAVSGFDRARMRMLQALLADVVAAFPDLRAGEASAPALAEVDTVALDAARRVVDDALLATDPTPPPQPRRHPPRRHGRGRARRR